MRQNPRNDHTLLKALTVLVFGVSVPERQRGGLLQIGLLHVFLLVISPGGVCVINAFSAARFHRAFILRRIGVASIRASDRITPCIIASRRVIRLKTSTSF
jgi:hypothetical protein